jgi:hypothetical protein
MAKLVMEYENPIGELKANICEVFAKLRRRCQDQEFWNAVPPFVVDLTGQGVGAVDMILHGLCGGFCQMEKVVTERPNHRGKIIQRTTMVHHAGCCIAPLKSRKRARTAEEYCRSVSQRGVTVVSRRPLAPSRNYWL